MFPGRKREFIREISMSTTIIICGNGDFVYCWLDNEYIIIYLLSKMKSFIILWFIMVEVVISRKHFRALSEMLHLFNLFHTENCISIMWKQMTFQLFASSIPKTMRKNLEWITKIWAISNCENDEEVEYHSDNTLREIAMMRG